MSFSAYFIAVLCVLSTLSNIFICLTMVINKMFKRSQDLLILLLAFSDFVVSVILMPTDVYILLKCDKSKPFGQRCSLMIDKVFEALWLAILPVPNLVILLMSLERFIAIKSPYRYISNKRKKIGTVYLVLWCYSTVFFFVLYFTRTTDKEYYSNVTFWIDFFHMLFGLGLPFSTNLLLYCYILSQVLKQRRSIKEQNSAVRTSLSEPPSTLDQMKENVKRNKVFIYITVAFLVLMAPYVTYFSYFQLTSEEQFPDCHVPIAHLLSTLLYFNSFCNIFIYGASSKVFRKSLVKLLCGRTD